MVLRRLLLSLGVLVAVGVAVQPVLAAVDERSSSLVDAPFVHGRPAPVEPVRLALSAAAIGTVQTTTVTLPPGSSRLEAAVEGSPLLARRLVLEVKRGGETIYAGPPARFRGASAEGGTTLVLRLSLTSSGSAAGHNALQGLTAHMSFTAA